MNDSCLLNTFTPRVAPFPLRPLRAQSTLDFTVILWPLNMFQPRPWKSQEDFKNHDWHQRASTLFLSFPLATLNFTFSFLLPLQSIRTLQDLLTDIYALKVSVETLGKEVAMLKDVFEKVDPPHHPS